MHLGLKLKYLYSRLLIIEFSHANWGLDLKRKKKKKRGLDLDLDSNPLG